MRKQSTKKGKRWLTNLLILCLLLLGLAMIFHNQIREFFIKIGVEKYQIENVSKQTLEENQTKEASFDFDAVESLSTESILKAQLEHKDLSVIGSVIVHQQKCKL